MTTTTFDFETASNYTLSQTQINASLGTLALTTKPAQTFTEDFADDTGFTYDSAKAEFTGGLVRAKDQRPANAAFGANFDASVNANWANGSLTGTAVGGAIITSGKLDLTSVGRYVDYSGASNFDFAQIGTIKFKLTPTYSGTPASACYLFTQGNVSGSRNATMQLFHSNIDGTFAIFLRDDSDNLIAGFSFGVFNPTAGIEYEIELNYDFTTGATRLFIDGVQSGSTCTSTFTRSLPLNLFRFGANYDGTINCLNYYNDLIVFSTVQHTSNYTPGYSVSNFIYLTSVVTLPNFVYPGIGAIQSLDAFATTEVSAPRYVVDGYYWTGSAWAVSDSTYAQANSASDVNTNLPTFTNFSSPITVKIIFPDSNTLSSVANAILTYTGQQYFSSGTILTNTSILAEEILSFTETHTGTIKFGLRINGDTYYWTGSAWAISDESSGQLNTAADINSNLASALTVNSEVQLFCLLSTVDTDTTPTIDTASFTYNFGALEPGEPATCAVYGYIIGPDNEPIADVTVTAETITHDQVASRVMGRFKTVTTDSNGYFDMDLVRSSEFVGDGYYRIVWEKENIFRRISNNFLVPDAASINITTLLT